LWWTAGASIDQHCRMTMLSNSLRNKRVLSAFCIESSKDRDGRHAVFSTFDGIEPLLSGRR
jgi:hypothetical protein